MLIEVSPMRSVTMPFLAVAALFIFATLWVVPVKAFQTPAFISTAFQKVETKMEAMENSVYLDEAQIKLTTGLSNVLVGWSDILAEPEAALENGTSPWKGLGKGFVDAFANTFGGLIQVVTFPLTQLDIPLPDGGVEL